MDYLKLRHELSDVPVNNDDEIEEPFIHFEKGTNKFEIWKWFDKRLPKGVAYEQFSNL